MTLEQIKELDGEIITLEQLEDLEQSEHVAYVQDNGLSGKHYNKHWYTIYLTGDLAYDEDEINDPTIEREEVQIYI